MDCMNGAFVGRYVVIRRNGGYQIKTLALCEVQVHGVYVNNNESEVAFMFFLFIFLNFIITCIYFKHVFSLYILYLYYT